MFETRCSSNWGAEYFNVVYCRDRGYPHDIPERESPMQALVWHVKMLAAADDTPKAAFQWTYYPRQICGGEEVLYHIHAASTNDTADRWFLSKN